MPSRKVRRSPTARSTVPKRATRKPRPPFPRQHQSRPGLERRLSPRPAYQAPSYRAAGKLEGQVALITGGDSGIGRAVAVLFAREGADIAIVHLPVEASDARETERSILALGRRALLLPGDLTRPAFARSAVARTMAAFGRIDLLVNNAAYQHHREELGALSDAQVRKTFATNVEAMFRLTRLVLPHLPRGGAILNTGSITGLEGHEALLDYAATKGAIHTFTKSLARQLVSRGIRVNCVAPGPVWTPLNVADKPAAKVATFGQHTPLGRPAQPEEVAPAFVFFASQADSGFISGEVLTILGGETIA